MAGSALAQQKRTEADWLRKPTPQQLFAVWPTEAQKRGVNGRATIGCTVSKQGALFGCQVLSEEPAGMGFGTAAIALTPQFLMKPATVDGQPVESTVRMPINFTGLSSQVTGSHLSGGTDALRGLPGRKVIADMPWKEAPAYADVAAAYPEKARAAGVGGRVTLSCRLSEEGRPGACDTVSEEPRGQGFNAAARRLLPKFRGPTEYSDGTPTAKSITQILFVFAPEMLDPARRIIGKPRWAALPTGDAMLAGYPRAAVEAGVRQARVTVSCAAGQGGILEDCKLEREEPTGLGFGAAGLELSKSFRIQPWTTEGLPTVGGQIRVPIRYVLPETPDAPKP